jgi:hypothetical protein
MLILIFQPEYLFSQPFKKMKPLLAEGLLLSRSVLAVIAQACEKEVGPLDLSAAPSAHGSLLS